MEVEDTFPRVLFEVGGVFIRDTLVVTWGIILLLALLAYLATRRLKERPSPLQNFLEAVTEAIEGLVRQSTDRDPAPFIPFIGTLAVFLVAANTISMIPGLGSPTKDVNTALALALVVFSSVHIFAVRLSGGPGYLKTYLQPHPLLLPFNVIGEISRTIALALRLFGNMLSGELIVAVLLLLAGFLVPIPLQLLGLLIGLIQAYVFTLLAIVYIAAALQGAAAKEGSS